jgi:hypothetical protein
MSKNRAAAEIQSEPRLVRAEFQPAAWMKAVISLLLAFHLTAVFIAPFAFACNSRGSTSPLADPVYRALHPYIAALFLDHGYFFFAPNPGPSHLVDYKLEFADGKAPLEGRFPDLAIERPRLLYHRHFMLSEELYNSFAPAEAPPEPSPPPLTASAADRAQYQLQRAAYERTLANWQRQRKRYEAMRASIEQHLIHAHGAKSVTLTRVEHRPPWPDEYDLLGRELNVAESYVKLSETPSGAGR